MVSSCYSEVPFIQGHRAGQAEKMRVVPTFLRPLLWFSAKDTGSEIPGTGHLGSDMTPYSLTLQP